MKKEYNNSEARRGAIVPQKGKARISTYVDNDVLEEIRGRADESGKSDQTMMNDTFESI